MTVDTLELTDSFLQEAQAVMGCDPDIPMHYRILCKLNQENELDTAKRFLEANRALFRTGMHIWCCSPRLRCA